MKQLNENTHFFTKNAWQIYEIIFNPNQKINSGSNY